MKTYTTDIYLLSTITATMSSTMAMETDDILEYSSYTITITHDNEHCTLHVLPFLQLSEGFEQKLFGYMHQADIVTHSQASTNQLFVPFVSKKLPLSFTKFMYSGAR